MFLSYFIFIQQEGKKKWFWKNVSSKSICWCGLNHPPRIYVISEYGIYYCKFAKGTESITFHNLWLSIPHRFQRKLCYSYLLLSVEENNKKRNTTLQRDNLMVNANPNQLFILLLFLVFIFSFKWYSKIINKWKTCNKIDGSFKYSHSQVKHFSCFHYIILLL